MSESSKENFTPQLSGESISIDENGQVLIRDQNLAKMNEQLSPDQLDAVAGGGININIGCGIVC